MTRIKAFDPNSVHNNRTNKWLSNTHKDDVPTIKKAFPDVASGLPKPYAGTTEEELVTAGIVGLYEA